MTLQEMRIFPRDCSSTFTFSFIIIIFLTSGPFNSQILRGNLGKFLYFVWLHLKIKMSYFPTRIKFKKTHRFRNNAFLATFLFFLSKVPDGERLIQCHVMNNIFILDWKFFQHFITLSGLTAKCASWNIWNNSESVM